jgi:hypothetical protein
LTVDERALLALRVSRRLSWEEIAEIQLGARAPLDARASCARVISREFQVLRSALKSEAIASGLLDPKS